jgi:ABC-type transport system involved in Fe-S cluster assembly fused permease/ATPase subunit
MDFLSASCRKHWRFVDAIYGVMPIFGMVLKSRVTTSQTRKEQLKELALQVVSTQVSDETNIVRLIDLAQQQGLTVFDIQLPYALEAQQLAAIQKECAEGIAIALVGERMTVTIPPKS